jgi:hypothetical protein
MFLRMAFARGMIDAGLFFAGGVIRQFSEVGRKYLGRFFCSGELAVSKKTRVSGRSEFEWRA